MQQDHSDYRDPSAHAPHPSAPTLQPSPSPLPVLKSSVYQRESAWSPGHGSLSEVPERLRGGAYRSAVPALPTAGDTSGSPRGTHSGLDIRRTLVERGTTLDDDLTLAAAWQAHYIEGEDVLPSASLPGLFDTSTLFLPNAQRAPSRCLPRSPSIWPSMRALRRAVQVHLAPRKRRPP